MTRRYLLDTNVLSEPLRPTPNPELLDRLREREERCVTAAPVWHELVFGAARLPQSKRRQIVDAYLANVIRPTIPVLPYDQLAASWHARERARLVSLGLTPPFVDGQIAAVAATRNLVLVTANTGDYANFEGLEVENWLG